MELSADGVSASGLSAAVGSWWLHFIFPKARWCVLLRPVILTFLLHGGK